MIILKLKKEKKKKNLFLIIDQTNEEAYKFLSKKNIIPYPTALFITKFTLLVKALYFYAVKV